MIKPHPSLRRLWLAAALILGSAAAAPTWAQDTVCASVKIRIKQELTMERQAFEAEMKINNTTDNGVIENVKVVVKVTELDGTPVAVTEDPNAVGAKFFIRVSNKQNILAVDGTGKVNAATSAIIDWLLIPAPGSAGTSALGKKYLVGATLTYRFGAEDQTLDVSPAVITVKPLPLLTLDYFLPSAVEGDDPLTTTVVEEIVPFTMGLRIKNNGAAVAKNIKMDSAQPKIVENSQGLLAGFTITGSYIDDVPAQNSLLINFGDIPASNSKVGRWVMESKLSGVFTEFTASFTHADELGGAVTSLLQATNAHLLIRDVRVDLPGRDMVRDFLSKDGDVIRVYESEGLDTIVTDRSGVASLQSITSSSGNAAYRLTVPPTDGFFYVKLSDPHTGLKPLGPVLRSDGKQMLAENVWLSRTRNKQTKAWEYFINFFDVNSTGVYDTEFTNPVAVPAAPVLQAISNKTVKVGNQVSFIVEAASAAGKAVNLSAAPLPVGASFVQQAINPASPGLRQAVFSWTPGTGTAGDYAITYTAADDSLSSSVVAGITVESTPLPGAPPAMPTIVAPLSGAVVTVVRPVLGVNASADPLDPTTRIEFEIYSDQAMATLIGTAQVNRSVPSGTGTATVATTTTWQVPLDLADNTPYWWRARAFDGTRYSLWSEARFFVNQFNDAPNTFNLTSPAANVDVTVLKPQLSWTNSADKDGDTLTYSVSIYRDEALTQLVKTAANLPADPSGITSWTSTVALTNHAKYYWRVTARDPQGALTVTPARAFTVYTSNAMPTRPTIVSPLSGARITEYSIPLVLNNSTDSNGDLITYLFELDTVNTFDSGDKRTSGQVIPGSGTTTSWNVDNLVENKLYYWRIRAHDERSESAWLVANFVVSAVNEAPPTPTISNPGNKAWVGSQQPTLQLHTVADPDRDKVHYEFEVYRDPAMSNRIAQGESTTINWTTPVLLEDKTTHYWRGRALDTVNLASGWSVLSTIYVSTGAYQSPTVQVTSPAVPSVPTVITGTDGIARKFVTLRWEGMAPNIEANVALYRANSNTKFIGALIVDGLQQAAGTNAGEYVWDVTSLPVGTHYIFAIISDPGGNGKAFAAGAVVISAPIVPGFIVQDNPETMRFTSEGGGKTVLRMRLGKAPTSDVSVPISSTKATEGTVSPAVLTFTPTNWSSLQAVTVTGVNDCAPDPDNTYQVIVGKATSLDPAYMNVEGVPFLLTNRDNTEASNTNNNPNIYVCGMKIISETQINSTTWEYQLNGELTNMGPNAGSITATLVGSPSNHTVLQPVLHFGAVNQFETSNATDTITVRTPAKVSGVTFVVGLNYQWAITISPP
jgi:hypothetical protein